MAHIIHVCASWEDWNGVAVLARHIMREQCSQGNEVEFCTWASPWRLRRADEVWIHCAWKPCLWWAALWAKKCVRMPHGSFDPKRVAYHSMRKRLVKFLERWSLRRRSTVIYGTCASECEWISDYAEIPRMRFDEKPPRLAILDSKRFFKFDIAAAEAQLEQRNAVMHLLYLGRRHPLKGVSILERALKEVEQLAGHKFELRVISEKPRSDLIEDWQWADMLVLPTISDNFGLVIAEALERGVPVLTTDGAPAWEDSRAVQVVRGFRDGDDATRVKLLVTALIDRL